MPFQIGDNVRKGYRGSAKDVQWEIDQGAGPVWVSIMPVSEADGFFAEDQVADEGIDGRLDVKWYAYTLSIRFYQIDEDTLAELYSADNDLLMQRTGMPTEITLATGQVLTVDMFYRRNFVAAGVDTAAHVLLTGKAAVNTSLFA